MTRPLETFVLGHHPRSGFVEVTPFDYLLNTHTKTTGPTGCGKSSRLARLWAKRAMRAGIPTIYFNLKGSPEDYWILEHAAEKNRVPFHVIAPTYGRQSKLFDLFQMDGSDPRFLHDVPRYVATLMAALSITPSHDYGARWFSLCNEVLGTASARHALTRSGKMTLASIHNAIETGGFGIRDSQHLEYGVQILMDCPLLNPLSGEFRPESSVNFNQVIDSGGFVYNDIPVGARETFGQFVLLELAALWEVLYQRATSGKPIVRTLIIIDECIGIIAQKLGNMLAQLRSFGATVHLFAQSDQQFRSGDIDLLPIIIQNTGMEIFMSASDHDDEKRIQQLSKHWPASSNHAAFHSMGYSSSFFFRHCTPEPLFTHNDFLDGCGPNRGIVLMKNQFPPREPFSLFFPPDPDVTPEQFREYCTKPLPLDLSIWQPPAPVTITITTNAPAVRDPDWETRRDKLKELLNRLRNGP